jgi:hypothetical protein
MSRYILMFNFENEFKMGKSHYKQLLQLKIVGARDGSNKLE